MINKGKVIQIIPNKKLNDYMFERWVEEQMTNTGKDLVVLENPEYPKGIKGYFLSFKRNKPDNGFPILMNSEGIKEGDVMEIICKKFNVETAFYEEENQ